jgi:hypothetical protein
MTQAEAMQGILMEWRTWAASRSLPARAPSMEAFLFYGRLQKERPDLLTFKSRGDRWQVVHGWLMRAKLTD